MKHYITPRFVGAVRALTLLGLALACDLRFAAGQATVFTYQGRLTDNGGAAEGMYDLRFAIYDVPSGGTLLGGPVTNGPTVVSNGLFTVTLDFGAGVFTGADRWLEIGARASGGGAFVTLTPRQLITATPYAVRALTAGGVPSGAITSAMLAPGSASANLLASGVSGVGQGGVVLSEQEFASNLFNQGYVRLGKVDLVSETWRTLTNGPPLGRVQVPPRRDGAVAWTGTEMLVWGGRDSSGALNTGGRYDPATDTWTPMSTSNAPSPQLAVVAAWTGTHLIVWGNSGPVRGGRYDPATDTWLPLNETNGPSPRTEHSAVWTGTHLIIWGGASGGYVNTGARYDPVADAWSAVQTSGAPAIRGRHSAVWTGTEMIIWGGYESHGCGFLCVTGTNYNDGARYNPASNTWQPMATAGAPFNRSLHSAVWTGTEMIVWGGLAGTGGSFFAGGTNVNSGGRYNPANNQWSVAPTTTGAPTFRSRHHGHWTGSRMLIWAGANDSLGTNFTDGAQYNPANNTWSAMNNTGAPPARTGFGTVWTGTQLLVWGGESVAQPGQYPAFGHRYTPATDSWSATAPSGDPSARADHTAVWAETEMLGWGGLGNEFPLRTGGRLNPSLPPPNMWSSMAVTGGPAPRVDHTAVWTGSNAIVWGGFNGGQALNTGGRYTPANDSWSAVTTAGAPTPRGRHVAVWTGSRMVVWGGFDGTNFLAAGARYNPSANTWQAMATVNAPSARADSAAVWTGTEVIVWGGRIVSGGVTNHLDTGARYNPVSNTWQPLPATGAPVGRFDHSAVWSGGEMIVWGGETQTGHTSSGARYQSAANQWIPLSASGAPSGRSQHTAVWAGTQMIVWGGSDGTNELASGASYHPVRDLWVATTGGNAPEARQRHTAVWSGTEMIVWAGRRFDGLNNVLLDSAHAYTPARTLYLYLRP